MFHSASKNPGSRPGVSTDTPAEQTATLALRHEDVGALAASGATYPNVARFLFHSLVMENHGGRGNPAEYRVKLAVSVSTAYSGVSHDTTESNLPIYLKFSCARQCRPLEEVIGAVRDDRLPPLQMMDRSQAVAALGAVNSRKQAFGQALGAPSFDHTLLAFALGYLTGAGSCGGVVLIPAPQNFATEVVDNARLPLSPTTFLSLDTPYDNEDEFATFCSILFGCGITDLVVMNTAVPVAGFVLQGGPLQSFCTRWLFRLLASVEVLGNGALYELARVYGHMHAVSYHGHTDEGSLFRDVIREGLALAPIRGWVAPVVCAEYKGVHFSAPLTLATSRALVWSAIASVCCVWALSDPCTNARGLPSVFHAQPIDGIEPPEDNNVCGAYSGLGTALSAGFELLEKNVAIAFGYARPTVTLVNRTVTALADPMFRTRHLLRIIYPWADAYPSACLRRELGALECRVFDLDGPVVQSTLPMFPDGTTFSADRAEHVGPSTPGFKVGGFYALLPAYTTARRYGLWYYTKRLNPQDGLVLVREVRKAGVGRWDYSLLNLDRNRVGEAFGSIGWIRPDNPLPADAMAITPADGALLFVGNDALGRLPRIEYAATSSVRVYYGSPRVVSWKNGAGALVTHRNQPFEEFFARGVAKHVASTLPAILASASLLTHDGAAFQGAGAHGPGGAVGSEAADAVVQVIDALKVVGRNRDGRVAPVPARRPPRPVGNPPQPPRGAQGEDPVLNGTGGRRRDAVGSPPVRAAQREPPRRAERAPRFTGSGVSGTKARDTSAPPQAPFEHSGRVSRNAGDKGYDSGGEDFTLLVHEPIEEGSSYGGSSASHEPDFSAGPVVVEAGVLLGRIAAAAEEDPGVGFNDAALVNVVQRRLAPDARESVARVIFELGNAHGNPVTRLSRTSIADWLRAMHFESTDAAATAIGESLDDFLNDAAVPEADRGWARVSGALLLVADDVAGRPNVSYAQVDAAFEAAMGVLGGTGFEIAKAALAQYGFAPTPEGDF